MKYDCMVYIDESGDLGVGKGTHWFVITAVIVDEKSEKEMRREVAVIKNQLNIKSIHFRKIREFNKKLYIIKRIRKVPFTIINVIVDTTKLELKDSEQTYNYMSRILLERVSWFLRDNDIRCEVVFSSRNTKRDNELTSYLNEKILNYSWNEISQGTIMSVTSEKMERLDMLQVADACAASMYKSLEADSLGLIYPCYMNNLKHHLYSYNGKIIKYGIKYYKDEMKPETSYYEECAPCDYWIK